jgi:pyruvate/2-oxoglutarate dehydrogenase complex dihydrolipoamide dehydrogenase (E3) component
VKAKVTLIEKHKLGGDCLNTGCVPSKAVIRSAKLLSHMQRSQEFGIRAAKAEFDFADVMERVQRVIKTVEPHDSAERYTELGVEVIAGSARLISPWEVELLRNSGERERLTTRSIVIATGGRPFRAAASRSSTRSAISPPTPSGSCANCRADCSSSAAARSAAN